jgi:hypothetical protein
MNGIKWCPNCGMPCEHPDDHTCSPALQKKSVVVSEEEYERLKDLLVQCHGLAMANGSFHLAEEIREVTGLKKDW